MRFGSKRSLMRRLAKHIADRRMLRLIRRRYREVGRMVKRVTVERHEGTPQGGPVAAIGKRAFG